MPEPLEITDASVANQVVYLALPLGSESLAEVEWPEAAIAGRFRAQSEEVRDLHSIDGDSHTIDVARVAPKLMLERDDRSAYAALAIGRILEKRPDGSLVMDPNFIPTMLSVRAAPRLQRFVGEMAGLMRERAKNIAERVGARGKVVSRTWRISCCCRCLIALIPVSCIWRVCVSCIRSGSTRLCWSCAANW